MRRNAPKLLSLALGCALAIGTRADAQEAISADSSAVSASADQPGIGQTTTSPSSSASAKLASFAGTVYHYFQETDLHPTLASVAPGGGLTGGIGFDPHRGNPHQLQNSLRASVSTKGYWLALADTTYRISNIYSLELYGRARHMTELPFYGIGQDSQLSNQTDFTLTERVVGGSAYVRPTPAFAVGGRIEGLWPMVRAGRSSSVPSIGTRFNDSNAPGLSDQPGFVHYQAFANFDYPSGQFDVPRHGIDLKAEYNVFLDDDNQQFSFNRALLEAQARFQIAGPARKLTLHALGSLTSVGYGSDVPFFFQETLGGVQNLLGFHEALLGTDETTATLRGFNDYRFRDRNLLLLQAEFRQHLWAQFDATFFVDAGKVTHDASQIGFSHLKRDVGVSLSLMRVDATIVRVDFAWAGGEGSHTFLTPGRVISP
jgi:hypothetical protein